MSLLVVENVSKRFGGRRGSVALNDVSFDIEPGEAVSVYGPRRSGRSTLIRVAAGILQPDSGVVRFCGRDLSSRAAVGEGIGLCSPAFDRLHGQTVFDQVLVAALPRCRTRRSALSVAEAALERVDALDIGDCDAHELHPHECARVSIARALVTRPEIVMLDSPMLDVGILDHADLHSLLLSLAHDDGLAVLAATGTVMTSTRVLVITDGLLRGNTTPAKAEIVRLARRTG